MEKNKGAAELVDRKEGYYWVRMYDNFVVAKYNPVTEGWYIINGDKHYSDSDFKEIDERQICRS